MTKTLIVAATSFEIENYIQLSCEQIENNIFSNEHFVILITGMGISNTVLKMSMFLNTNQISSAVNIGFCGSFSNKHQLSSMVHITKDCYPEMGVISRINIIESFDEITKNQVLLNNLHQHVSPKLNLNFPLFINLPSVHGITVLSCTNNEKRAEFFKQRFYAEVESMEGAAFFQTCNAFGVASAQVRVVSNLIPGRSKKRWDIENSKKTLHIFMNELSTQIV
jgi:futalosine hydrolase